MDSLEDARVKWALVQLKGESVGDDTEAAADDTTSRADGDTPASSSGSDHMEFLVSPPNGADAERLAIKSDLSDAQSVMTAAVQDGYWIHGAGYFQALLSAVRGHHSSEYRGSQEPLRILAPQAQAKLVAHAEDAIAATETRSAAALKEVGAIAALLARRKLAESRAEIVQTTVRYVEEAGDEPRAVRWLNVSEGGPGAYTFEFNETAGLDLVTGMMNILGAHLRLSDKNAALADAKRTAGKEMQRIAAARWMMLRAADRANTPSPRKTITSSDYGVELMNASNPVRPDLVAKAERAHPDPAGVIAANVDALAAAAELTSALVDEGAEHPILYRIWSPTLASAMHRLFERPGIGRAEMKIFTPENRFRYGVAEALRSSFRAAEALADRIAGHPAHVWRYPLLIEAALAEMRLADDDFIRIAAEHRIDQLAEEAEATEMAMTRASEVLMVAQLAVRFIPAPQVQVPANIALIAIDTALGALHLIGRYLRESDTRDAFRAFLNPGNSFAVSDGSYLGTVVGAAFLLFGIAGLSRTTIAAPSKRELAVNGGLVAHQEYSMFSNEGANK
jgi:hypothetical protein